MWINKSNHLLRKVINCWLHFLVDAVWNVVDDWVVDGRDDMDDKNGWTVDEINDKDGVDVWIMLGVDVWTIVDWSVGGSNNWDVCKVEDNE